MTLTSYKQVQDTPSNDLQFQQYQHDVKYHADIHTLPLPHKFKHITLHLGKYAYGLTDIGYKQRNFIDGFIMVVSAANALNINLLKSHPQQLDSWSEFLSAYLFYLAKLAKTCESFDHFEDHEYIREWTDAVINLYHLFVKEAERKNIDLFKLASERLVEVETKIEETSVIHKLKNLQDRIEKEKENGNPSR